MAFKENLLKKIQIDKMSKKVIRSIGPPDSGRKTDRETMRHLLDMGLRKFRKERDLDLFILDSETACGKILVLDNELAIYNTTPEDVALRRSATVREMLNIRNIIRILNDADVVISKREDSVRTIRKECIDLLDMSFDRADLDAIENDGRVSLEKEYADGVTECLSLFAELLDYVSPPKAFRISNHNIVGASDTGKRGETLFGPVVIYSIIHNSLKLIDAQLNSSIKEKAEFLHQVAVGKEKASKEGPDVFEYLKEAIVKRAGL